MEELAGWVTAIALGIYNAVQLIIRKRKGGVAGSEVAKAETAKVGTSEDKFNVSNQIHALNENINHLRLTVKDLQDRLSAQSTTLSYIAKKIRNESEDE